MLLLIILIASVRGDGTGGVWRFDGAPINGTMHPSIGAPGDGNAPIVAMLSATLTGPTAVFKDVYVGANKYKVIRFTWGFFFFFFYFFPLPFHSDQYPGYAGNGGPSTMPGKLQIRSSGGIGYAVHMHVL